MRAVKLVVYASLTLAFAACSDKGSDAADATPPDSMTVLNDSTPRDTLGRPMGAIRRPASMNRHLVIEGDSQLVAMQLYTPPASFPLQFTTYHPGDMQAASAVIGTNASVTITPMFNGKSDPNAFFQFQTDVAPLQANDPAGAALNALTEGTEVTGLQTTVTDRYPWATAARSFRYTSGERKLAGTIIVGKRDGRSYVIFVQYPEEFGDGMGPRIGLILRQWRWEDDFTYLVH